MGYGWFWPLARYYGKTTPILHIRNFRGVDKRLKMEVDNYVSEVTIRDVELAAAFCNPKQYKRSGIFAGRNHWYASIEVIYTKYGHKYTVDLDGNKVYSEEIIKDLVHKITAYSEEEVYTEVSKFMESEYSISDVFTVNKYTCKSLMDEIVEGCKSTGYTRLSSLKKSSLMKQDLIQLCLDKLITNSYISIDDCEVIKCTKLGLERTKKVEEWDNIIIKTPLREVTK